MFIKMYYAGEKNEKLDLLVLIKNINEKYDENWRVFQLNTNCIFN